MDVVLFAALAAVTFAAAALQAATGFGFAILSVPFFLLIMGSLAAIQVTAVTNLALSLLLIPKLYRDAPKRLLLLLIAGSSAGFPLGLAAFRHADLADVKLAVGIVIVLLALFLAQREWRSRTGEGAGETSTRLDSLPAHPVAEAGVGVISGAMAAALAMPGPVVILYLFALQAGKAVSRAATLTLFGFSYGAVCLIHTLWGGMNWETWKLALFLVPFGIAGGIAGHIASGRLSERRFRAVVLAILIVSGLYAVWSAL